MEVTISDSQGIVAQWVKLLFGDAYISSQSTGSSSGCAFLIQLLANVALEAPADAQVLGSLTRVKVLNSVLGSWFKPGPALAVASTLRKIKLVEDLILSLSLSLLPPFLLPISPPPFSLSLSLSSR